MTLYFNGVHNYSHTVVWLVFPMALKTGNQGKWQGSGLWATLLRPIMWDGLERNGSELLRPRWYRQHCCKTSWNVMLGVVAPTNQTFFAPKQADLLQDRFERGFPFSQAKSMAGLCHACFLPPYCWIMGPDTNNKDGKNWNPVGFCILFWKPRFLSFLLPGEFKRNLRHNGGMEKV